jgi:NAD-dependent SIR2 family protein deacetylase
MFGLAKKFLREDEAQKLPITVIGTSLQVYPAAGLIDFTNAGNTYYIDPKPIKNSKFEKSTPCNFKKSPLKE